MDQFILKVLSDFVPRGTDASGKIGAPVLPIPTPMLRPAERDQVEPKRITDRGIVFGP